MGPGTGVLPQAVVALYRIDQFSQAEIAKLGPLPVVDLQPVA